ncbi:MAG: hypothetical protein DRP70_15695 [Spirochaetes bacterium]|nr:MAG: hypothetical protein DRP70_15695 [Spirochaetota bacterium]
MLRARGIFGDPDIAGFWRSLRVESYKKKPDSIKVIEWALSLSQYIMASLSMRCQAVGGLGLHDDEQEVDPDPERTGLEYAAEIDRRIVLPSTLNSQ